MPVIFTEDYSKNGYILLILYPIQKIKEALESSIFIVDFIFIKLNPNPNRAKVIKCLVY